MWTSELFIPDGFIVFISGVPGVGKTTLSYELLNRYTQFRIIQETDLMREILRGYNQYLNINSEHNQKKNEFAKIHDSSKFLNYEEASIQCEHMKYSLNELIGRQQRKGISTIINGVHIVPEVLKDHSSNNNVVFINLFISNKQDFFRRFDNRDEEKYSFENIEYIYEANLKLHQKTVDLESGKNAFFSLDVGPHSISHVVNTIIECINNRITFAD